MKGHCHKNWFFWTVLLLGINVKMCHLQSFSFLSPVEPTSTTITAGWTTMGIIEKEEDRLGNQQKFIRHPTTHHKNKTINFIGPPKTVRWKRQLSHEMRNGENYQNFKFKPTTTTKLQSSEPPPVASVFLPNTDDFLISIFYGPEAQSKLEKNSKPSSLPGSVKPAPVFHSNNNNNPPPSIPTMIDKRMGEFSAHHPEYGSANFFSSHNPYQTNMEIPNGAIHIPVLPHRQSTTPAPNSNPNLDLQSEASSFELSEELNEEDMDLPKGAILIPPPRRPLNWQQNPDQQQQQGQQQQQSQQQQQGQQQQPDQMTENEELIPGDENQAESHMTAVQVSPPQSEEPAIYSFESEEGMPEGAVLIPAPRKPPPPSSLSFYQEHPHPKDGEKGLSAELQFSFELGDPPPPQFQQPFPAPAPPFESPPIPMYPPSIPQETQTPDPEVLVDEALRLSIQELGLQNDAHLHPTGNPHPTTPMPTPIPIIPLETLPKDRDPSIDDAVKLNEKELGIPKGAILIPARRNPIKSVPPRRYRPPPVGGRWPYSPFLGSGPNGSSPDFLQYSAYPGYFDGNQSTLMNPQTPSMGTAQWPLGVQNEGNWTSLADPGYYDQGFYGHRHRPKLDPRKIRALKRLLWQVKRVAFPLVQIAAGGYVAFKALNTIDRLHYIKKTSNESYPLLTAGINHLLSGIVFNTNGTNAAGQMMNPLSFLPILTTSIALTIIAIGIFLRFIVGGPIMSMIFMYMMLLMSPGIVRALDTVNRINEVVPLTTYGKIVTGVRSFLGMSPTEHLPILGGVRVYNRDISKTSAQFLRTHPDIHTIITPSIKETKKRRKRPSRADPWWCRIPGMGALLAQTVSGSGCDGANSDHYTQFQGTYEPHKDSYVNLTSFYSDPRSRKDVQDFQGEFFVFCDDKKSKKKKKKKKAGKSESCTNALALAQKSFNPTATNYYFDLKDGNDTAVGRRGFQNTFLVEQGHKFYQGQDQDDTFILAREGVTGLLDGGGGDNSLIFRDTFEPNRFITLDLTSGPLGTIARNRTVLRQSNGAILRLDNINRVEGRAEEGERVIVGCTTKFIDGKSGKSRQIADIIEIPGNRRQQQQIENRIQSTIKNDLCPYNLTLKLSKYTKVFNHALQGSFTYLFPSTPSEATGIELNIFGLERLNYDLRGQHQILLNWKLSQLNSLSFQQGPGILSMRSNNSDFFFSTKVVRQKSARGKGRRRSFVQQPTFHTMLDDGTTKETEIRVGSSGQLKIIHRLDRAANRISSEREGYPGIKNIFGIFGERWILRGGSMADTFKIYDRFTGYIDGGGSGQNLLVLTPKFLTGSNNTRKNRNGRVEINLKKSYLTYNSKIPVKITVENIQKIIGRRGAPEEIVVNCESIEIDGRGGNSHRDPDIIMIPRDDKCTYNITMAIRKQTIVRNFAVEGEFFYEILRRGVFDVESNFPLKTIHNYILPQTFRHIKAVLFDSNTNRLSFQYKNQNDSDPFHVNHGVKFSKDPTVQFNIAPNILTKDGVSFKVDRQGEELTAFIEFKNQNFTTKSTPFRGLNEIHHQILLENARNVNIFGGHLQDTFVLEGEGGVTGSIDGMDGDNSLKLSRDLMRDQGIYIDFLHHQIILDDSQKGPILKVRNISNVYGRPDGNETIVVGCNTKLVAGQGGHDMVIVHDLSHCPNRGEDLRMEFIISSPPNGTTRVFNSASVGTFVYRLEGLSPFQVQTKEEDEKEEEDWEIMMEEVEMVESWSLGKANHIYQYSFEVGEIDRIQFHKSGGSESGSKILFKVKGQRKHGRHTFFGIEGSFYDQPRFVTKEQVEIMVERETGKIFFGFKEKTASEVVKEYEELAGKLNVTMVLVGNEGEKILVEDGGVLDGVLEGENLNEKIESRGKG